jgi:uncharacterized protein
MPEKSQRLHKKQAVHINFQDDLPFHIISLNSLNYLNEKLSHPIPMDRFRPNFVVSGCPAHSEDHLNLFTIGSCKF